MPAVRFNFCCECRRTLQATFFCQACGQPCCCLDCYCRHDAMHDGRQDADHTPALSTAATRLETAG